MADDLHKLRKMIAAWNENRLDLFALSEPNEEMEFHGVMRFYFQEPGHKVATKCLRVSSTATTQAVIDALVEKFHPDMRMLSDPVYRLHEVHLNGDERQLEADEKPLLVQLTWHNDNREGRFVLRRMGPQYLPLQSIQDANMGSTSMKRKLSKRDKKKMEKREQQMKKRLSDTGGAHRASMEAEDARSIYDEVPPTTFTRTISNPEIVMKKRRERQVAKLRVMGEGGSVKIYGPELSPSRLYVTLLVAAADRADKIVRDTLEKYGLDKHDAEDYCLFEVTLDAGGENADSTSEPGAGASVSRERPIADDECPLRVIAAGSSVLHCRRRPAGATRHRVHSHSGIGAEMAGGRPCLVELNPDATEIVGEARVHPVEPNVTEVGSDRALVQSQSITLFGPYVYPRHCVLAYMDGVVTLTPCVPTAEIHVDGRPIGETTVLRHGQVVRIGRSHVFRLIVDSGHELAARSSLLNVSKSASLPRSASAPFQNSGGASALSPVRQISRSPSVITLETTFALDGLISTEGAELPPGSDPVHNENAKKTPPPVAVSVEGAAARRIEAAVRRSARPAQGNHSLSRSPSVGRDSIPAIVELADSAEDAFLTSCIHSLSPEQLGDCRLAPAYALYMSARYRLNPHYHPAMAPQERALRLRAYLQRAAEMVQVTVQDHCHDASSLVLWMANASELLNFCKCDMDVRPITEPEPQEQLAEAVERAFGHLTACFRLQLRELMPDMLVDDDNDEQAADSCVRMLSGAMSLLRACKLNAAFTIQLFSQLFHYVNMYLFNWLVSREGTVYCTRRWAKRLTARLARVQAWALRQGLELAAECHLDRICQALRLLEAPKAATGDLAALGGTCYKLNSAQVRSLLQRYICAGDEPPVPKELIEDVIAVAENQADDALRSEGRPVRLEEEVELALPFLLPEDGYSADTQRGIAQGLRAFVDALQARGLCRVIVQPTSSGAWTVYFGAEPESTLPSPLPVGQADAGETNMVVQQQPSDGGGPPRVDVVSFAKRNGGIGLSIVQAQGESQPASGIYIKKVMPNSAAYYDGRLEPGDQLLKVNGQTLINITQEQAARIMASSGDTVQFEVAKRAAFYSGLARILDDHPPPANALGQQPVAYGSVGAANSLAHQRFASTSAVPQAGGYHPQQQQRGQYYGQVQPGMQQYHSQARVAPSQYSNLPGPMAAGQQQQQQPPPQAKSLSTSHIHHAQQAQQQQWGQPQVMPVARGVPVVAPANGYHQQPPPAYRGPQQQQQSAPQQQRSPLAPPYPGSGGGGVSPQPLRYSTTGGSASSPHSTQSSNPPGGGGGGDRLSQTSGSARAPPPAGWQRDEKEHLDRMIHDEMLRLLRDEADRLEHKEYLSEDEQRRYRMVKLELAYRSRLNEDAEAAAAAGNRPRESTDSQPPAHGYGAGAQPVLNGNGRPTSHNSGSSAESLSASSAAERARVHDAYYAAAEGRLIADMKLHGHDQHNAQLAREAVERQQHMNQHPQQLPTVVTQAAHRQQQPQQRVSPQHRPFDSISEIEDQASRLAVDDGPEMTLSPVTSTAVGGGGSAKKAPPPPPPKRKNVHFGSGGEVDAAGGGQQHSAHALDFPPPPTASADAQVSPSQPTYVYNEQPGRTQVLGAQEVYRDPRQRRLDQLSQRQATQGTSLDGANLPFRDKMRLFAAQLGESSPKDRAKVSSAQRDIEHHQQQLQQQQHADR